MADPIQAHAERLHAAGFTPAEVESVIHALRFAQTLVEAGEPAFVDAIRGIDWTPAKREAWRLFWQDMHK